MEQGSCIEWIGRGNKRESEKKSEKVKKKKHAKIKLVTKMNKKKNSTYREKRGLSDSSVLSTEQPITEMEFTSSYFSDRILSVKLNIDCTLSISVHLLWNTLRQHTTLPCASYKFSHKNYTNNWFYDVNKKKCSRINIILAYRDFLQHSRATGKYFNLWLTL